MWVSLGGKRNGGREGGPGTVDGIEKSCVSLPEEREHPQVALCDRARFIAMASE